MRRGQADGSVQDEVVLTGSNLDFWPRGKVLFEDTFNDGLDGWTELMTGTSPVPGPIWTSRITSRGSGGMLLQTGDALDNTKFGTAVGIKRLMMPFYDGIHLAKIGSEYLFDFSSEYPDRPRAFDFGLDTQTPSGTRHWYKIRFQNYDESASQQTTKWQVLSGNAYADIPGAGGFTIWNEGKANMFHIKFVVDLEAQKYVSFWVNGKSFDLSGFSAPTLEPYAANFEHGMNYTVEVRNRTDASRPNWCRLTVPYVRGTVE
jgi:hypothetical protein